MGIMVSWEVDKKWILGSWLMEERRKKLCVGTCKSLTPQKSEHIEVGTSTIVRSSCHAQDPFCFRSLRLDGTKAHRFTIPSTDCHPSRCLV